MDFSRSRLRVRQVVAWALWFAVVFALNNLGASHSVHEEVREALARREFRATPGNLVKLVRSHLTDDDDIARYLAYSDATLGRPYDAQFVRTLPEWEAAFASGDPGASRGIRSPPVPMRPNRDFLVEYPPGFFLVALPPALLTRDLDSYNVLFSSLMALLLTLALLLTCRIAPTLPRAPTTPILVAASALAALAGGSFITHRYDAVVSLSLMAAAWALFGRRPVLLGIAIGIGVAAKLVPLLAAPVLVLALVQERRWSQPGLAAAMASATVAAIFLPAFLGTSGWSDVFRYHGARPLQLESSAAVVLGLASNAGLTATKVVFTYGSLNLVGPWPERALAFTGPLTILGLAFVYLRTWRALGRAPSPESRRLAILHGIAAALVLSMVLGKVFSPQYLVWLIPLGMLLALVRGGASPWLFGAVLFLSHAVMARYVALLHQEPWACGVVLARNALLVFWAFDLARASRKIDAVGSDPIRP